MKRIFITLFSLTLALGLGFSASESEAARMGGGRSLGMSRNTSAMKTPTPAPTRQAATSAAAPQAGAATPPRAGASRWLGPLAGLAAGVGLAAMFSHFGLGGMASGLGSILMMVLFAGLAFFILRRFMGGMKARQTQTQPSYAAADSYQPQSYQAPQPAAYEPTPSGLSPVPAGGCYAPESGSSVSAAFPAGFDEPGFVRQAKLNFTRLQAANDRGDMDDIKTFTTPEVFAEVDMQYQERGRVAQRTEIIQVDAQALEVLQEEKRYVASVKFYGQLREEPTAGITNFEEIWHLVKPLDGSTGWLVAGIQQIQ